MKFSCKYCNYNTDIRCNYDKHLVTFKHHKNKKNCDKSRKNCDKSRKNCDENRSNCINWKKYTCKCCNYTTTHWCK